MTGSADDEGELPAGSFAAWADQLHAALAGEADADVACDGCTACCASRQFVHVGPEEVDALAHIPAALLFPAPGLPDGHLLMGYDERSRCPMLRDEGCSIYAHRPRTCRTYDCRIFPATGVVVDKPLVASRAARWRFDLDTDRDRTAHERVLDAARAMASQPGAPADPTARAVAIIRRAAGT